MWRIIGHDWAVQLLEASINQGNIANAYLLTGPDGVGKRTLALEMARALCCTGHPRPCDECDNCRAVIRGSHPDVLVIGPQDGSIKIDQVRELRRRAMLAPHRSRYKIYIITDAETATPEAANSLLKTLEEPPKHLVLILTASNADALLPTIVSRCQVINLRPVPLSTIEKALRERWDIQAEEATFLAHVSTGCPGVAIKLAQDEGLRDKREREIKTLLEILKGDVIDRFEWAASASRDPTTAQEMLERWLTIWRDMLLLAEGRRDWVVNLDFVDELGKAVEQMGKEALFKGLRETCSTVQALKKNANLRLALEVLMLNLPCTRA